MLTTIFGALMLLVVLGAIALILVCMIDVALRHRYECHAERKYREKYRRWCAQTPARGELTFVCGKGYEDEAA